MKVVLTGADGLLGWHVRTHARAYSEHEILPVSRHMWSRLPDLVSGADVVVHLAGVNRGTDAEVLDGNRALAAELGDSLRGSTVQRVVYANSVRCGEPTPYGLGKLQAAESLSAICDQEGKAFVSLPLPNIYGEHARPYYNSFVATFVEKLATNEVPVVTDNMLPLAHAQDAAAWLLDAADGMIDSLPDVESVSVSDVWDTLCRQFEVYQHGEFPDLSCKADLTLFNCLRARLFYDRPFLTLEQNRDPRGVFVESSRASGGAHQSSFSTTVPGVTRGDHFHLRKVERFVVISGSGLIKLRRVEAPGSLLEIPVTGETPVAVDMPTGWAHNITNVGQGELITQFWVNEPFDVNDSDTFGELV